MRDRPTNLPLTFENVSLSAGQTSILAGFSGEIRAGRPTVLMGPNGSGKTTLLKTAMGLVTPGSGKISFAGRSSATPRSAAFVFQKPVMLRRTAEANVAFALQAAGYDADRSSIRDLLDSVGLAPLALRPARRLSGGEQQRLALARALARRPEILFLDEPTANLDPAQTQIVEGILESASAGGVKVVLATHDIGQARRLAGDVMFLVRGRLVEHTAASQFFQTPASDEARRFLAGELIL